MKDILFCVQTEGHFLTTLGLILEKYNCSNGFRPIVVQYFKAGNSRIDNFYINTKDLYLYIQFDEETDKISSLLKLVNKFTIECFFFFLEQHYVNIFLCRYLKRRNAKIVLVNDGCKPYYIVNRNGIKTRIRLTLKFYWKFYKEILFFPLNYFMSFRYGNLIWIDELWMPFLPKQIVYKRPVFIYSLLSKNIFKSLNERLNFNLIPKLVSNLGIILYTNNLLLSSKLYETEISVLKYLKAKYPACPLIIKYHPYTPAYQIEQFKCIADQMLFTKVPAEIYIALLSNSIVLSGWSASLFVSNKKCNFYWLTKYFESLEIMVKDLVNITNPVNHVLEVEHLEQIEFPSSK